jgi:hypothetical protein
MIKGKYLFFWKNKISQWSPDKFKENDIEFNCCEQYMMYKKAILFRDYEMANKILNSSKPGEIKDLGRKIKDFDQDIWNLEKENIVYTGNYLRFSQNPKSWELLKATYPYHLVETSPYDTVWGIGMDEKDEGIDNPDNWKGENLLGKILTRVRNDLMKDLK